MFTSLPKLNGLDWFKGKNNLKKQEPSIFHGKIQGFRLRCSLQPIHWKKLDIPPAMVVPQSAERRKKIDIGWHWMIGRPVQIPRKNWIIYLLIGGFNGWFTPVIGVFRHPSENMSQLGWWHSKYMESHNPFIFQTTNQPILTWDFYNGNLAV